MCVCQTVLGVHVGESFPAFLPKLRERGGTDADAQTPTHARLMLTLLSAALSEAPRYWPKFSGARTVVTLDGEWSFGLLDRPSAFDSMSPSFSPADAPTPNTTSVPSCFDEAGMGELGVRGVAFYRTTFEHAGRARLQFQACSFYCRVFVDGEEIGEHTAGGYVAFALDVPAAASPSATRELFVLADNRFNRTTAPMHTGGEANPNPSPSPSPNPNPRPKPSPNPPKT